MLNFSHEGIDFFDLMCDIHKSSVVFNFSSFPVAWRLISHLSSSGPTLPGPSENLGVSNEH